MAGTFLFELVSPDRLLLSEQVSEVLLPAGEGYITVMANHAPMITTVIPGIVRVKGESGEKTYVVFGGFADITQQNCSLLAESATLLEQYDRSDLKRRIDETRAAFEKAKSDEARNQIEAFLHQLTTVEGVLTEA